MLFQQMTIYFSYILSQKKPSIYDLLLIIFHLLFQEGIEVFLQTFLLLKENENEEMGIASEQASTWWRFLNFARLTVKLAQCARPVKSSQVFF